MVRRAQMQKQLDMSSTEADKLLKKAGKMNDQLFNGGGTAMPKRITTTETVEEEIPYELEGLMSSKDRGEIRKIRDPDDDTGGLTADDLTGYLFPKRAANSGNNRRGHGRTNAAPGRTGSAGRASFQGVGH